MYPLTACLQFKCVCFVRMFGDSIALPHIYGARIKGVEVFCPLDPPPPYEAVASQPASQVLIISIQVMITLVLLVQAKQENYYYYFFLLAFPLSFLRP